MSWLRFGAILQKMSRHESKFATDILISQKTRATISHFNLSHIVSGCRGIVLCSSEIVFSCIDIVSLQFSHQSHPSDMAEPRFGIVIQIQIIMSLYRAFVWEFVLVHIIQSIVCVVLMMWIETFCLNVSWWHLEDDLEYTEIYGRIFLSCRITNNFLAEDPVAASRANHGVARSVCLFGDRFSLWNRRKITLILLLILWVFFNFS